MSANFKEMIDQKYSIIVESLPAFQFPENLAISVTEFLQQVEERLKDQPEKYAKFKEVVIESGARMIEKVEDEGRSKIRLIKGIPDGAAERIKASLEGHDDLVLRIRPFLHCKFRVSDEVSAEKHAEEIGSDELPRMMENKKGVDKELVIKWCGFLNKIGEKLSSLERWKYEFMKQLNHFNLKLINLPELVRFFTYLIGLECPDLMHEFLSLLGKDKDVVKHKLKAGVLHPPRFCKRCHRDRRWGCHGRNVNSEQDDDDFDYLDTVMAQLKRARESTDTTYLQRFIREMYGDRASDIQSIVEKDPDNVVPIVMCRVLQKLEENKEYREHLRDCKTRRARRTL